MVVTPPEQTLYEILGLQNGASENDIKKAYHAAVFQLHPDRNSDPSACDKFIMIEKAYSVLSSREKRRAYDLKISMLPKPGSFYPRVFGQNSASIRGRGRRRRNGRAASAHVGWTVAMCPLCGGTEVIRTFRDGKFVIDPCPQCGYNHKTP